MSELEELRKEILLMKQEIYSLKTKVENIEGSRTQFGPVKYEPIPFYYHSEFNWVVT